MDEAECPDPAGHGRGHGTIRRQSQSGISGSRSGCPHPLDRIDGHPPYLFPVAALKLTSYIVKVPSEALGIPGSPCGPMLPV